MEQERQTSKCPECGDVGFKTPWSPPKGIDQRLRQYKCKNLGCRSLFYARGTYHTKDRQQNSAVAR